MTNKPITTGHRPIPDGGRGQEFTDGYQMYGGCNLKHCDTCGHQYMMGDDETTCRMCREPMACGVENSPLEPQPCPDCEKLQAEVERLKRERDALMKAVKDLAAIHGFEITEHNTEGE